MGGGLGEGGGIALYAISCYGYLPIPQKSNGNLKILFVEDAPLKKENKKKIVSPRLKRLLFSVGKIAH